MLEYTCEEAKDLLTSKLETAKTSLKNTLEDLEFLRDQITTMEVSILFFKLSTNPQCIAVYILFLNHIITLTCISLLTLDTARVYNWDVKQRRILREQAAVAEASA